MVTVTEHKSKRDGVLRYRGHAAGCAYHWSRSRYIAWRMAMADMYGEMWTTDTVGYWVRA